MITFKNEWFNNRPTADQRGDNTFGNILFFIASTIGIAVKNRYNYGFPEWNNAKYFVNPLPPLENQHFKDIKIPEGNFRGFDVPDNSAIFGYMQSEKYFAHCKDLVRFYFTLKPREVPAYKDCVLIHCRNYAEQYLKLGFTNMPRSYYMKALKHFPDRRVIVITDDLQKAKDSIKEDFEYISTTPIDDFYVLSKAQYLIGANSTFSWWAAWLSKANAVFPADWFPKLPVKTDDVNCKHWITL